MSEPTSLSPSAATIDPVAHDTAKEFAGSKVLIIDDDPTTRFLLRGVTTKLGIGTVMDAEDGTKGLELAEKMAPDVILLDIVMPGIDGFEVCKRLRANPVLANTAILIQTGLEKKEQRIECFAIGASDVISKPLNIPEFTARIRLHLRNTLYAKKLSEFRQRMQIHLNLVSGFVDSVLPNFEQAKEQVAAFGYTLDVLHHPHEEVGGDLWYVSPVDEDRLLITLVDASAHGVAGAISALRIDSFFREADRYYDRPGLLLNELDTHLSRIPSGNLFAGITTILLNRGLNILSYASSGNPPPLLCRKNEVVSLSTSGMPVGAGMTDNIQYDVTLHAGESLVVHSDGWPGNDGAAEAAVNAILGEKALNTETLWQQAKAVGDDATIILLTWS